MKNYKEWHEAAVKEYAKLVEVSIYLNAEGRDRMDAFDVLTDLAGNCKDACSLLEMIYNDNDVTTEERVILNSGHAKIALWELQRIAEKEVQKL